MCNPFRSTAQKETRLEKSNPSEDEMSQSFFSKRSMGSYVSTSGPLEEEQSTPEGAPQRQDDGPPAERKAGYAR